MLNKRFSPYRSLFLALAGTAFIGMMTGCGETTTNGTSKKDSTKAATAQAKVAADPGLTLPVLDALFYEDGFSDELKTKLQLTDAQITKLKNTARAAVEELTEDGTGDYTGSSRAAARKSEEQIRSILGDAKADQLFALLAQRYAGGDVEGMMPTTPNAVPKDTRIVVNAPAYRMDLYQEGKLVKTYKVGIGYPEFPLPTGMRRAETIIFNPTWTPPDEPWVKGKVQPGEKVEAGSKLNPLGPIKIPIGLPSLIHGGKQPAKLGTFASHGCVGLTNEGVQDFALSMAQLGGSQLTGEDIKKYESQRTKTENFKLQKAVPIELRYETIVVENGAVHVYRDVYERGTNTPQGLQLVLNVYGIKYESLPAPEQQALMAALQEMNRDPQGNPVAEFAGMTDTSGAQGKDVSNEARARQGKETKTIKGRKEVVVPVASLAGKGYPAPVNLVAPAAPATAAR